MKSPFSYLIPGPEAYWSLLFVPALLSYICMLQAALNTRPKLGSVERLDAAALAALLAPDAALEVIADGNLWAEGPVWVHDQEEDRGCVFFIGFVAWEGGDGGGIEAMSAWRMNALLASSMRQWTDRGFVDGDGWDRCLYARGPERSTGAA